MIKKKKKSRSLPLPDNIPGKASESFLSRIFCGYFRMDKGAKVPFAGRMKKSVKTGFLSTVRGAISRFFTESPVMNKINGFLHKLLYLRTRDVGIFMLSCGLYSVIEYFILKYAVSGVKIGDDVLYSGAAMFLLSFFFMSKRSIADTFHKKYLLSFLVFDLLGANEKRMESAPYKIKGGSTALFLGMAAGILAFLLPPWLIAVGIVCVVLTVVIFCMPETGAVLMCILAPFLPINATLVLCVITTVSYIIKAVRKKRAFRFGLIDISVIVLAGLTLFGKMFSVGSSQGGGSLYLIGIAAYFVCRNLLGKREWIGRALNAVALSCAVMSFLCLFVYLFGTPVKILTTFTVFESFGEDMTEFFGTPSALASYILLTSPMLLFKAAEKGHGRLMYFLSYIASFVCLCFTMRFYAVISVIITVAVISVIYNKKFNLKALIIIPAVIAGAFALPSSAYVYLGSRIYAENTLISNVWHGTGEAISSSFLGGYGIGSFRVVYPLYAVEGYASAPTAKSTYLQIFAEGGVVTFAVFAAVLILFVLYCFTCLKKCRLSPSVGYIYAPLASVISVMLYAVTENVLENNGVCMMLFAVIGLGTAAAEISRSENEYAEAVDNYVEEAV